MFHTAHIHLTRRVAADRAREADAALTLACDGDRNGRTDEAQVTRLKVDRARWATLRTRCFRALGG